MKSPTAGTVGLLLYPKMCISEKLSLGELRSAARLLEAVLLSFLRAGIAGKEAFLFEGGTAVGLRFQKGAGDTQTDRAGLAGITAADYVDEYVVFIFRLEQDERLFNDVLKSALREIILESAVVDDDGAAACGNETHAGDRLLSSARSPELKLLTLSSSGFCAA